MRFTNLVLFVAITLYALASRPVSSKAVEARSPSIDFEDFDFAPMRARADPPSQTVPPVIAPRPTGSKPNNVGCRKSADCQSGNCQNGHCQDPQPLGAGCYKDISCRDGTVCTSHSRRNPGKCVCQKEGCSNGSFCTNGNQCAPGSFCPGGKQANGVCTTRLDNGSDCKVDNYCQSGNCVNKKCVDNGTVSPGSGCTKDVQCANGNFCSILSGNKCKAKFPSGHVCSRDYVCSSGNCVGGRKKRCA